MEQYLVTAVCFPTDTSLSGQLIVKFFSFWPEFIFYFGSIAILFQGSIFVRTASFILLFGFYYYLKAVAVAIEVPRPAPYDPVLCHSLPYALPDARFVSAMVYTFIFGFGYSKNYGIHLQLSRLSAIFLMLSVSLFLVSTIISGYFTFDLLGANLLISVTIALIYWKLYVLIEKFALEVPPGPTKRKLEFILRLLLAPPSKT
jgi:hypothetical protein